MGPASCEMEFEERPNEPFLFFAADKTDPGAYNLPLYLAVTLFVALWIAVGGALLIESIHPSSIRAGLVLVAALLAGAEARAQAPDVRDARAKRRPRRRAEVTGRSA